MYLYHFYLLIKILLLGDWEAGKRHGKGKFTGAGK